MNLPLKKRTLNFRLTEDQYQLLQKASLDNGARSISDYARGILLSSVGTGESRSPADELMRRISDLETRVSAFTESTNLMKLGDPTAQ